MKIKSIIFSLLILLPFFGNAWTILQNTGGKASGMGGAFVSRSDAASIINNQAGLAALNHVTFGINYENRFASNFLSERSAFVIVPTKAGSFGLSFQSTGTGTWAQSKSGLSYSRFLSDKIKASLTFNFFTDKEPDDNYLMTAWGFEAGLIYAINPNNSLGLHISNPHSPKFSGGIYSYQVPWKVRLGGHSKLMDQLIIGYEIEKTQSLKTDIRVGAEFEAIENFTIRGGYATLFSAFSFGVGFQFIGIAADLGFKYNQYLGFTPSVTLAYSL